MNRLDQQRFDEITQGRTVRPSRTRVLQFGEGGFLRGFADHAIDLCNSVCRANLGVVVVSPRPRRPGHRDICSLLEEQDNLYTLCLRGRTEDGPVDEHRLISCIRRSLNAYDDWNELLSCALDSDLRFIISNTTEAGIRFDPEDNFTDGPASSFPGKLTQLLYHRFQNKSDDDDNKSGLIILPCELIDHNGAALKDAVVSYARLWQLGDDFLFWLDRHNRFYSTLVDRIVTGYPTADDRKMFAELGYEDALLDVGEPFASWVIEAPASLEEELPLASAGFPVIYTDRLDLYKMRKVRILNGAHTAIALGAYLSGHKIMRDCMQDECILRFLHEMMAKEILPTIPLPEDELTRFSRDVTDRFNNPFIDHKLLSIALNSTSKWKARILPTLLDAYNRAGTLPVYLTASLAFYIAFCRGAYLPGYESEPQPPSSSIVSDPYPLEDSEEVIRFFAQHRDDSDEVLLPMLLARDDFWGMDLCRVPGLVDLLTADLNLIRNNGAKALFENL